jgi:outer membrane protein
MKNLLFLTIGEKNNFEIVNFEFEDVELNTDEILERGLQGNPDLLIKKIGVEIAKREKEISKSDYYPTLEAVGSLSEYETMGGINGAYLMRQSYIGIRLNVPIYEGGKTGANVAQSEYLLSKAKNEYEYALQEKNYMLNEFFEMIGSLKIKQDSMNMALKAAKQMLDAAEIAYNVNAVAQSEVLSATDNYYSVQKEYFATQTELAATKLKLYNESIGIEFADK